MLVFLQVDFTTWRLGDDLVTWFPYGFNGESAFESALANGFVGTETQWLNSLVGLTNYQIALNNGFVGTEVQWLATLNGTDGNDGITAYQLALNNGFVGTEIQWLNSLKGTNGVNGINGKSTYQLALDSGFVGSEAVWLNSLKGTNGIDGKSAYQFALDNGFVGTEAEWLNTLGGVDGKSAYQIAVDNGFVGTEGAWLLSLQGGGGGSGSGGNGPSIVSFNMTGNALSKLPLQRWFPRKITILDDIYVIVATAPLTTLTLVLKKNGNLLQEIILNAGQLRSNNFSLATIELNTTDYLTLENFNSTSANNLTAYITHREV
jgi:hypothetical protein